jgi:sirohydrochlorin cobaltochelatase
MPFDRRSDAGTGSAVLLCGHGTRDARGAAQFEAMVAAMQSRHPARHIVHGFLELAHPGLDETVGRLYAEGVRHILAVPVLLFAAGHLTRDLPDIFVALEQRHDGLRIRLCGPIGLTPDLLETACRLAERAAGSVPAAAADTCLLVIGRGTSASAVNAEAARLAHMLAERLGWGFATTGYVAVTRPGVAEAMRLVDHLPFGRVVVLPLVLFSGRLYQGIARDLAERRAQSPRHWVLADPFCTDDAWLGTLDARIGRAGPGEVP